LVFFLMFVLESLSPWYLEFWEQAARGIMDVVSPFPYICIFLFSMCSMNSWSCWILLHKVHQTRWSVALQQFKSGCIQHGTADVSLLYTKMAQWMISATVRLLISSCPYPQVCTYLQGSWT
jgi:hypothetical protein